MSEIISALATRFGSKLTDMGMVCAVAESCTGGLLAAAITDIAGSSGWFDRGFVTYSNAAKVTMLNVKSSLLDQYGAVSKETVCAMAEGALKASQAQVSVAISGIAGPTGGSATKPVGTVWIAWGQQTREIVAKDYLFTGNRTTIRMQAVQTALAEWLNILG